MVKLRFRMFMISEKFVHLSHVKLSHIHCHFSKTNHFMFGQNCWTWQFCSQPFFGGVFLLKQVELFTSFFPNLVFVSFNTVLSLDQLTYLWSAVTSDTEYLFSQASANLFYFQFACWKLVLHLLNSLLNSLFSVINDTEWHLTLPSVTSILTL